MCKLTATYKSIITIHKYHNNRLQIANRYSRQLDKDSDLRTKRILVIIKSSPNIFVYKASTVQSCGLTSRTLQIKRVLINGSSYYWIFIKITHMIQRQFDKFNIIILVITIRYEMLGKI